MSYDITLFLMDRGLGLVNLGAFLSIFVQRKGLIFDDGLYPAHLLVSRVMTLSKRKRHPGKKLSDPLKEPTKLWSRLDDIIHCYFNHCPSLLLLSSSNLAVSLVCIAGIVCSLLTLLAVPGTPVWLLFCLLCYLSLKVVSGPFLGLQMDATIIETDFVVCLCYPWRENFPLLTVFVIKYLVFRIMLGCGMVKWNGSGMWRDLTAMTVHYWTQPLPNPLSYHMHHLPRFIHKTEVAITLFIEIPLSVLVFVPSSLVQAFVGSLFIGLNTMINITGNYGHLGLLTSVQCLVLVDDFVWSLILPKWLHVGLASSPSVLTLFAWLATFASPTPTPSPSLASSLIGFVSSATSSLWAAPAPPPSDWQAPSDYILTTVASIEVLHYMWPVVGVLVVIPYVMASTIPLLSTFKRNFHPSGLKEMRLVGRIIEPPLSYLYDTALRMHERMRRFRIANYYGKFGSMRAYRWEIVLQGWSEADQEWRSFGNKWKPSPRNTRNPPFVYPLFLPRLDWRLWFLPGDFKRRGATGHLADVPEWYYNLLDAVLCERASVCDGLLGHNPFKEAGRGGDDYERPQYIRGAIYNYEYIAPKERTKDLAKRCMAMLFGGCDLSFAQLALSMHLVRR
eukprot:TRINITY_DN17580_c0_g1_i1.p1 TRINITY_DN17580_c0_g1~~TRINITY_DN17580_c0_g1_i1.p1  ORF type:complete len:618 (+),score=68.92 TRINITY_DN17580_c0_g1_i1:223-2076(+)